MTETEVAPKTLYLLPFSLLEECFTILNQMSNFIISVSDIKFDEIAIELTIQFDH